MIQSLRILETAAGLALLLAPDKAKEYLESLGVKVPTVRGTPGMKDLLS